MIVVGTTYAKGEDIAARGNVYVFDVIDVVPDPDEPGKDLKLKLVGEESIRGALTAVSGIGGQGFMIVAQGQKCMVRGLKDDGSLLPGYSVSRDNSSNGGTELTDFGNAGGTV